VCDGCGQAASTEHISRRLRRLEWTTRYRPVHINTLVLGAFSPHDEKDFCMRRAGSFAGKRRCCWMRWESPPQEKTAEGGACGVSTGGILSDARAGVPVWTGDAGTEATAAALLMKRLQPVATRIRRSLKPKRVMAITEELTPVVRDVLALDLGCPVVLDHGKPFRLESGAGKNGAMRLREALAISTGS